MKKTIQHYWNTKLVTKIMVRITSKSLWSFYEQLEAEIKDKNTQTDDENDYKVKYLFYYKVFCIIKII